MLLAANAVLFLEFLLLIPFFFYRNLRSNLLSRNKRDRIETLSQCEERSQFEVEYHSR